VAPAGAIYAVPQQCHQQRRRQKAAGGSGSPGELTYIRTHVSCVTHIRAILSGELLSLFLVPETKPQAENNLSSPRHSSHSPPSGRRLLENHLIALCPVNSCLLFLDVTRLKFFQFPSLSILPSHEIGSDFCPSFTSFLDLLFHFENRRMRPHWPMNRFVFSFSRDVVSAERHARFITLFTVDWLEYSLIAPNAFQCKWSED
jgi:hypothetical protein